MSSSIITVDRLSKLFIISHEGSESYTALRDVMVQAAKGVFKRKERVPATKEEFWALKDVSFEVEKGDRIGIIGRNGAGKSTLLKILSRITMPTEGRISIRGRVASLLEVGTGFHPELTGRENIFLNGAILGMSRSEIRSKFDEIVDFAEVERFLDTPVKRYSSGMYVRLAFAVAAHLEPEILIVDEVLAVGDAQFQKKCLGKMDDVSKNEGRTVLFVSHNLDAVKHLCNKGVLLNKGTVQAKGNIRDVISAYLDDNEFNYSKDFAIRRNSPSITRVELDSLAMSIGELKVRIHFESPFELNPPIGGFVLYNLLNVPIFGSNTRYHSDGYTHQKCSKGILVVHLNQVNLHSGSYKLTVWLADMYKDYQEIQEAIFFEYHSPENYVSNPDPLVIGSVDKKCSWSLEQS